MKRSLMHWLSIALLFGLHLEAKAQSDAQAKNNTYDHLHTYLTKQAPPQSAKDADATADLQTAVKQLEKVYQNPYIVGSATDTIAINPAGWWDTWSRSGDLSLVPADDAMRAHLGLPKGQGLIVAAVAANTPAAQAGVQQNDVLLELARSPLAKPEDLEEALKEAGNYPAPLTVLRGGKKVVFRVQPHVRVTMGPVRPEPPAFWIGIQVSELEPALRAQLKIPASKGLLAIEVIKEGPAAKAKVKVHDILLSLAGKPLDSQKALVDLVQANGEKTVPLEFIREGRTMMIDVTPERRKPATTQVLNVNVSDPRNVSFFLARPGLVDGQQIIVGDVEKSSTFESLEMVDSRQATAAAATISKRLDDFEAELKHLRTAIEELSKVLKDKK